MLTMCVSGDPDSPAGSIHPRNKSEVGRRLSLQALDIVYGHQLVSQGPTPRSFAVAQSECFVCVVFSVKDGNHTQLPYLVLALLLGAGSYLITVQFSTSGALKFNGTQYCKACCSAGNVSSTCRCCLSPALTLSLLFTGNDPFEVLDSSTGKWVQGTSSILVSTLILK